MSRTNGKKDNRHASILKPATHDLVALGFAVQQRFLDVCDLHKRLRDTEVLIPSHLDRDMLNWRTMMVRFKKGDHRANRDEELSTRRIAQWTLDINNTLRNQPLKAIEWTD